MVDTHVAAAPLVWVEFTRDMCAQLNSDRCLIFAGDAALLPSVTLAVDAASHRPAVVAAFAATPACAPSTLTRVAFTTAENQLTAQRCTAIYGRTPFVAVLDMRDDDDEHTFVFDLADRVNVEGVCSIRCGGEVLTEAVAAFLVRVGCGVEPRGRQGAAPPPADLFAPTHGAVLCEARAAVTSTFTRLQEKSTTAVSTGCHCPSGALCVFWSDRCPCCPGVLMLVEALVRLIRLVAARHADHPASTISFTFPFLVANIDDNDFTPAEWPVAKGEQVVPSLVAYPSPTYAPVVFSGERSLPRLAHFICTHCLPSGDCVACTPHIAEEVAKAAAQLSIDELMTVVEEGSAAYATATAAFEAFEDSDSTTPDTVAAVCSAMQAVRTSTLPFSLEAAVRRVSAEGGAAASGTSRSSLIGENDGGAEGEEDEDAVAGAKSGSRPGSSAGVAPTTAEVVATHKRARE